jgi:hypothetical protein
LLCPGLNANWPHLKYHLSHVGVVTFVNRSQRVPRFVKSALALVCNVRFNGAIRWKDYDVFTPIFHTTAEALCFVKKLAKFFTTMFHLASFYGNDGTKFPKIVGIVYTKASFNECKFSPTYRGYCPVL